MKIQIFKPNVIGCFGKLPAYGDFVRVGLEESMVARLDTWCRTCLIQSRSGLGQLWERSWMTAPIWRFLIPPGASGGKAMLGVWLPSMDKAGRHYPFIVAALSDDFSALAQGGNWLAVAEAEAVACVVQDKPYDAIVSALSSPVSDSVIPLTGWWTEGSPFVKPKHFEINDLLFADTYASAMLHDHQPTEILPC